MAAIFGRPCEAVRMLLAFCGCLRMGESLALRADDVLLPRSASEPFRAVLFLRVTKRGFDQRVVLRHPEVVRVLLAFAERWPQAGEQPFA
eukprot:7405003-Lingulodinium_polyedra.AAC.1